MSSLNGTVIGRLGQDPEVKALHDGTPVVEFSVAVDNYKKDSGTTWVRASLFGARGPKLAASYKKGDRFAASGRFELEEWTNREGNSGKTLKMRINEVDFIHDKHDDAPEQSSRPTPASNGNGAPAARRRF